MATSRKSRRIPFKGLDVEVSPYTTKTGKTRYVFYVFSKPTLSRASKLGELHANNISAAAGAALKQYYPENWRSGKNTVLYISDKPFNGSHYVAANWSGKTTATKFAIFDFSELINTKASRASSTSKHSPTTKSTKSSKGNAASRTGSRSSQKAGTADSRDGVILTNYKPKSTTKKSSSKSGAKQATKKPK